MDSVANEQPTKSNYGLSTVNRHDQTINNLQAINRQFTKYGNNRVQGPTRDRLQVQKINRNK